ncbi:putative ribonuclease H-like domain-containing protein [Tanacetum coccineum]
MQQTGNIAYLSDFKEFDGGYVTFGGGAHGGRISSKGTLKTDSINFEDDATSKILKNFIKEIENLVDKKVKIIRCDNGTKFKNKVMDDFCKEKGTIINESADFSYFDSSSKDVGNVEPKSVADDQKQVEDGLDNENDEKDKSEDDSSL